MVSKKDVFNLKPLGKVEKFAYKNGLVYLHNKLSSFQGAYACLWVHAGSIHEPKDKSGMAHLLEHLIFREEPGKDFVKRIETLGGEVNAYTSKEYTCYELSLLGIYMSKALPLFLDLVLNPTYGEKEFKDEKNVVIQEIRDDMDDYESLAYEKFFQKSFSYAMGHPISGSYASLKKIQISDVRKFYQKYYTPSRMGLFIGGRCDTKKLLPQVNDAFEHFGDQSKKKSWRPPIAPSKQKQPVFKVKLKKDCEQATIILGSQGASIGDDFKGDFHLLGYYLTDGMSSVLYKKLREEQGIVYGIGSSLNSFITGGIFDISLTCQKQNIKKALQTIHQSLKDIAEKGISEKELKELKKKSYNYFVCQFDSLVGRSECLMRAEMFHGKTLSLKDYLKVIEKVTSERIQLIVRKMLKKGLSQVIVESK